MIISNGLSDILEQYGFTSARREVVELLRQRSRPYLFSNTVAPSIVGASLAVLDLLEGSTALRDKLDEP